MLDYRFCRNAGGIEGESYHLQSRSCYRAVVACMHEGGIKNRTSPRWYDECETPIGEAIIWRLVTYEYV